MAPSQSMPMIIACMQSVFWVPAWKKNGVLYPGNEICAVPNPILQYDKDVFGVFSQL